MNLWRLIYFLYFFLLSNFTSQAANYPFSHYCFLNQTANIINKDCTKYGKFTYEMNVITYEAPATIFLSLTSPWDARCPKGKCPTDTNLKLGYDFSISKGCINDTQPTRFVTKPMTSIRIDTPANTNDQYFITLYKKWANNECSYLLSKGTFFSQKVTAFIM